MDREQAYLIDLDFAAPMYADDTDGAAERKPEKENRYTFALPFLAIDLLSPTITRLSTTRQKHFYWHDLESFFWSMWWTILTEVKDTEHRKAWASTDMTLNRHRKLGFLAHDYAEVIEAVSQSLWSDNKQVHAEDCAVMENFLTDITEMFQDCHKTLKRKGRAGPTDKDEKPRNQLVTIHTFASHFPTSVTAGLAPLEP